MPLSVSVVTPSYNQGRFLERTIQSVLSQAGCGPIEYLVMDGGSRDESVQILERYGGAIQWVSEKDRGQADAVNKGLARATGEIIGWLNSDDIYYPGAIRAARDYFAAHPEADLVYGEANHIDEHDGVIEPYPTEDWNFERLKNRCFLCQPAVFFRRRVVDRFGPLDANRQFSLDYEYWLRLGMGGARFERIGALLAGSRMYSDNKTLGARVKVHSEINDMLRDLFGSVPDRWLFNYGHYVAESQGIARTRRLRFAVTVAEVSLRAAWRWNHKITPAMLKLIAQWVVSAIEAGPRG